MAAQPDLWGEIQAADVRTPVSILKEQAALLGSKTGHALEGQVETELLYPRTISHSFNVVVPALDNYAYHLFSIRHSAELYPVDADGADSALTTEAEFTEWLRRKLSSPDTKRVVGSLLAQANS
jgi:hypothetical protein